MEKISDKNLPGSYGSDDGGGDSVGLLKYLTQRFGPVSTFSGSYSAGTWTLKITGNSPSGNICSVVSTGSVVLRLNITSSMVILNVISR